MRERQRPEQHRVDDAEDGGVHADAEREREDDDGSEAGPAAQHAQRVSNILEELIDYIAGHSGVWWATHADIARYVLDPQ